MQIKKILLIFLFLLFSQSAIAKYKIYFYNSTNTDNYKIFLQIFEKDKAKGSYGLILNKGEYWQISAEQFSILNFANLLQFERSETACSQLELFNTKITHGYFLKFSINHKYIGEICATKFLPSDNSVQANLEVIKNDAGKFILKLSNAGWFSRNSTVPNFIEVVM